MVNVRRPDGAHPKYRVVEGSTFGGLYPSPPEAGRPVVICEGEFDCLLLRQEAGPVVNVVTLGSASTQPSLEAMLVLMASPVLVLAHDADAAGDKAASNWLARTKRAKRLRPIRGKDITEMYLKGVALRAWVKAGLTRASRSGARRS